MSCYSVSFQIFLHCHGPSRS